uniref:Uncharacterized protein n=1 Tax=Trichogramma kaykai TaxID=54128 RepID=A0ABD2WN95_9HYME
MYRGPRRSNKRASEPRSWMIKTSVRTWIRDTVMNTSRQSDFGSIYVKNQLLSAFVAYLGNNGPPRRSIIVQLTSTLLSVKKLYLEQWGTAVCWHVYISRGRRRHSHVRARDARDPRTWPCACTLTYI